LLLNASSSLNSPPEEALNSVEVEALLSLVDEALYWNIFGAAKEGQRGETLNGGSLDTKWGCRLEADVRKIISWYCAQYDEMGGEGWALKWLLGGFTARLIRIPKHVALQLSAAVSELMRVVVRSREDGTEEGWGRFLSHLRLAKLHAQSTVEDPRAGADVFMKPSHLVAVYASFWAPILPPLAVSLLSPVLLGILRSKP